MSSLDDQRGRHDHRVADGPHDETVCHADVTASRAGGEVLVIALARGPVADDFERTDQAQRARFSDDRVF
jgi:hypothetical protein